MKPMNRHRPKVRPGRGSRSVPRSEVAAARQVPTPRAASGFPSPADLGKADSPPLDFAILCERYRDAPGGVGFDPRRSAEAIAERLRVSPATVRRRLTAWRTGGFFLGYDVLPHPSLWGGRWSARILEFPDAVTQGQAVRPLSLIDGVIQIVPSRNLLLAVYFVDSEAQSERRLLQLREIPGPKEVGPEMPFPLQPCTWRMTRSDWRMVRALRRAPEAPLAALALGVGQSQRTVSRRLNSLLDANAVMFDPVLDFSRFSQTVAVVSAILSSPERTEAVRSQIRELSPHAQPSSGPTVVDADDQARSVQFLASGRTAAELDEWSARVERIPGVERALLWYEQCSVPVRDWLDDRIERELASGRTGN